MNSKITLSSWFEPPALIGLIIVLLSFAFVGWLLFRLFLVKKENVARYGVFLRTKQRFTLAAEMSFLVNLKTIDGLLSQHATPDGIASGGFSPLKIPRAWLRFDRFGMHLHCAKGFGRNLVPIATFIVEWGDVTDIQSGSCATNGMTFPAMVLGTRTIGEVALPLVSPKLIPLKAQEVEVLVMRVKKFLLEDRQA